MNFAAGIRSARERAGLSQRKLGRLAGFDPTYVCMLESGKRLPSVDALEQIALTTGVSMGMLIFLCIDKEEEVKIKEWLARHRPSAA